MALRINTNVAALNAHKNMIKTDNSLSSSLEKLSSGLRINKAADDASGMAIADSLRSQALGLGQAIRNGNDGISIVQTADAALEESINIVNTIKQKSIQSAQDGQTTDSRKAIQADISKLREELDVIAKTTAFNNQKLLSGNFTDKKFQIGAYAGETVDVSIQSTEANKIGHVVTSDLSFGGAGASTLSVYSNLQDKTYDLNSIDLAFNNSAENGVGKVADAINKLSDVLGISATASVASSTDASIKAGTTDAGFAINGVTIGQVGVGNNDGNGALVAEINKKTSEHGVTASVDQAGILTMTSTDNRAIEVTMGGDNTRTVFGGTANMSTIGVVEVRQEGSAQISISDATTGAGAAVSTLEGGIVTSGNTLTTHDSVAAAGSLLTSGSELGSGTVIQGSLTVSVGGGATTDGNDTIIAAGSTIGSGSSFYDGTTIQGEMTASVATTTIDGSKLMTGSTMVSGSTAGIDSVFEGDVTAFLSGAGVLFENGQTKVSGAVATVRAGMTLELSSSATLGSATVLGSGSVLTAGSKMEGVVSVEKGTVSADMTLTCGSVVEEGSILKTGSSIDGSLVNVQGTVTGDMTMTANTTLADDTFLADGSSFGEEVGLKSSVTVASDMLLATDSSIATLSTLATGTVLGVDIVEQGTGATYAKGSTLEHDVVISGAVVATSDMNLASGSILKLGSLLARNDNDVADTAASSLGEVSAYRLSDVDVTTQEGAQIGIAVADAALKNLDKVRSDLGSVQNQLTSTIANISTTKVNVQAAESNIRDVDFAEESANFTKMQILAQAGTFAMSQANASAQGVLSLLQ